TDEEPCEKYRQFLHSSRQERTVVIGKLVDISAEIIDSIWHPRFLQDSQRQAKIMSTRNFIHEILKRSKTTYSTLQISLFYLFRVKKVVHERLLPEPPRKKQKRQVSERLDDIVCCGRRMFLASLMVASKYLHDKNYRNRAWAKISGLDIDEINAAELAFLRLIDYKLYVSKPTFDKWYTLLHGYVQK
ncbi:cyclin-domain-containing protein, partial [Zychaea mexicana]|uniref:cyclin-domain-containing protein n=1 Tax=Zychaea mexicana TaxID=64656 RepID=UPI0022FE4C87